MGVWLTLRDLPSEELVELPSEGKPCSPHSDVLLQTKVLHLVFHSGGAGQGVGQGVGRGRGKEHMMLE